VVTRVWENEIGELMFNQSRVSVLHGEKRLEMDGEDDCTAT
jgi:hypothetical protein